MPYTEAPILENIPIKAGYFIGNTLPVINRAVDLLDKSIKAITLDKIPEPSYLTTEGSFEPIGKQALGGNVLTYDPVTTCWIPSAVPSPGPSFVKQWVSFRAATGLTGTDTKVLSHFNTDKIVCHARGSYEIFFERVLEAEEGDDYPVFATGLMGGNGSMTAFNIDCKSKDRFSYYLKWDVGNLKFGSTINAFVFSGGAL